MVDRPAASAQDAGVKGAVRVQEPDRSQRAIARRSAEARATVPDVELSVEVDMDACLALRLEHPYAITAILVRACALALREVPRANGAYRDGRFELYSRINVGVTMATEDAYTIPTVFDADGKSVDELSEEIGRLAERARTGQLSPPELAGATFTLSNPGALGVASSTPLIVPPQAAALATGAIRGIPVLRAGALVAGHCMTITLACDHRILYGSPAARFLTLIKELLERAAP
jgi:pyruvate dehydrogenase E2 component (dihydrolipoamide acetyltransferase)